MKLLQNLLMIVVGLYLIVFFVKFVLALIGIILGLIISALFLISLFVLVVVLLNAFKRTNFLKYKGDYKKINGR